MTLEESKDIMYSLIKQFFIEAEVLWAEQYTPVPQAPYLTLKVRNPNRHMNALKTGDGNRYYQYSYRLEVNLYTLGKPITFERDSKIVETGNYSNTAVSDLMDLFNFLDSEEIVDILGVQGMSCTLETPVNDVSELETSTAFRYRAMAEATITYAQLATNKYGIGGMSIAPNYSGGGNIEMVETESNYFEEVEIEEGGI